MRIRKVWLTGAGVILVIAYLASGVYFVQPSERGVVRWLGWAPEAYRKVAPGLHYALPWPLCRVEKPKTTEVRRVYVGMMPGQREAIARGDTDAMRVSPESDMFTGDVNILKVTMVVQYQVFDPAQYLFGADNPGKLIRDTVQGVLVETLAGFPVDEALTVAKAKLQADTLSRSQQLLDHYGCGVRLVAVNLESIEPPWVILDAFQDVVSAKKDGEKAVDRAVAESNRILPRARGEAAKIGEEAQAYRQSRTSRARGQAARFLQVLAEYRKEPEVFKQRLLLQTLEAVLPKVRTYVLDHKVGDPPTHVRIVEPRPD
jgi:membrane protease subunit HflK